MPQLETERLARELVRVDYRIRLLRRRGRQNFANDWAEAREIIAQRRFNLCREIYRGRAAQTEHKI